MQCPRCLNTDREYFFKGSRGWYCRKCISFGRVMLEEESEPVTLSSVTEGSEEYMLAWPLTPAQKIISSRCAELIDTSDVLIHAVCGGHTSETGGDLVICTAHGVLRIPGTNYECLYLLDFTLFCRHYMYNLDDLISREKTDTEGVHVFMVLDLVYRYTIHAKNPHVLKCNMVLSITRH